MSSNRVRKELPVRLVLILILKNQISGIAYRSIGCGIWSTRNIIQVSIFPKKTVPLALCNRLSRLYPGHLSPPLAKEGKYIEGSNVFP